ncbi:cysteine desulfurase family protein [uncultured Ruthenibacterium sp.]|uniref:cysteine desulfurase family protein n=1 Tax=uncultured Ruthenibacterium sp. TaxID=1905347 RepID=UPI00349EF0D0
MHYLDNAATTRVDDAVADMVYTVLRQHFANPSSLYAPGAHSEMVIDQARQIVANSLGAKPEEIYFTASGTEADNIAVFGACKARRAWADHVVVTGYEHPAVQNAVTALERDGWRVSVVNPDKEGHITVDQLVKEVCAKTALVAAMHVNNEVGSVLDVAALAKLVKEKNNRTAVHVDGVQAWCKLPIRLNATQIDSYAVSGHKIHAPKGVGALYLRRGYHLDKFLYGGHQEKGMRPGTENTAFIAALGCAVERINADRQRRARVEALASRLWTGLENIPGIVRNSPADAMPDVCNFSVENIKSETMLHYLEAKDIYVSSGSACSKGEASHTLQAMGLPRERVDTAVRVSFCGDNTPEDVDALLEALRCGVSEIAKIRR